MIDIVGAEFVAPGVQGPVRVLHPISVTLTDARTALIGENGSGKSTLVRMFNGLVKPSTGTVRVGVRYDGEPRTLDVREDAALLRKRIGFVFTDPNAQLVMPTVIEDVALSLRKMHAKKAERVSAAHAVLERFGLEELAERSVHSLSGGQQQQLAIASVLASAPEILVADEPTTLLDLKNARKITELLCALPQQLVVATHDLELAARCDRVIVLHEGRVRRDSADFAADSRVADTIEWYRGQA